MFLSHAASVALPRVASSVPSGGQRDFDFLFGRWQIDNERLRQRLCGCRDWDRFAAVAECRPALGGAANVETFETDWQGGFRGLALRLFDAQTQRWSIHWASDRSGALDAPVVGRFEHGVGEFFGPEQHHGVTVLSRYRWSDIVGAPQRASAATWDQAWSTDAGRSWETNWIMRFTRID